MSSNIVVGILAGMGPRSMISFLEKVIHYSHELYGAKNDSDYPNMLIYSLATPSYTVENIDHGSMKNCIQKGVESLKQAKVNYLAIPSNYAHTYYDFISRLQDSRPGPCETGPPTEAGLDLLAVTKAWRLV